MEFTGWPGRPAGPPGERLLMHSVMDFIRREHERLRHLTPPETKPMGLGTVRFIGHTESSPQQVIARARAVMAVINENSFTEWPDIGIWKRELPVWFVEQCAPEMTQDEAEAELARRMALNAAERAKVANEARWTLANWLYWLEPENRQWFWWDAAILAPNHFAVAVEVVEWPFPSGALIWLFRVAGARELRPEE